MANQKKTFFLCSTWDFHPDGPIQLGNIIFSPSLPNEPLNQIERQIPTNGFPTTTKTDVQWSVGKLRSGHYGLWTEFLSFLGFGVDVGFSHDKTIEDTYSFDKIDTFEFMPTPEYLAQAMSSPAVVSYLQKSRFKKRVYMITAIKVVHGAKAKTVHSKSRGGEFGTGLDGTLTGAPVSFGPEFGLERGKQESGSFGGSSDFVFAFRLRKVVVRSKGITHTAYEKGAMYEDGGGPAASHDSPFLVEGLAEADASAQEFQIGNTLKVVDGEEDCVCVPPEDE